MDISDSQTAQQNTLATNQNHSPPNQDTSQETMNHSATPPPVGVEVGRCEAAVLALSSLALMPMGIVKVMLAWLN